jgi:hypothetical protein
MTPIRMAAVVALSQGLRLLHEQDLTSTAEHFGAAGRKVHIADQLYSSAVRS